MKRTLERLVAGPLLAWCAACMLVIAFAHLGSEVREGETTTFDTRIAAAAQQLRAASPGLGDVMRDISGIGSTAALTLITLAACGFLALTTSIRQALLLGLSVSVGALAVHGFKLMFDRVRPGVMFSDYIGAGPSFPSGHSSMSAIVFLTLGVLVARTFSRGTVRAYIIGCAALLTLLIGTSRIILGVHWATDVLAGWALGSAWATIWLLVAARPSLSHP